MEVDAVRPTLYSKIIVQEDKNTSEQISTVYAKQCMLKCMCLNSFWTSLVHVISDNYKSSIVKNTLPLALKKSLLQNDTQLNMLYTKTGRHFKIQDDGRQGAYLAWHWPSKNLLITNLAMNQVSCFYHKMHFFTYQSH